MSLRNLLARSSYWYSFSLGKYILFWMRRAGNLNGAVSSKKLRGILKTSSPLSTLGSSFTATSSLSNCLYNGASRLNSSISWFANSTSVISWVFNCLNTSVWSFVDKWIKSLKASIAARTCCTCEHYSVTFNFSYWSKSLCWILGIIVLCWMVRHCARCSVIMYLCFSFSLSNRLVSIFMIFSLLILYF